MLGPRPPAPPGLVLAISLTDAADVDLVQGPLLPENAFDVELVNAPEVIDNQPPFVHIADH